MEMPRDQHRAYHQPVITIDRAKLSPEAEQASKEFWEIFNSLSPRAQELVTLIRGRLFRPQMPLLWEGDQA